MQSSTIAALATAAAPAGIGIIRLSGEDAISIGDRVFRAAGKSKTLQSLAGYTALYGSVFDEEGKIDDCVALVFRAPHSYTGENVVELSCHGGLYVLQRVLRAALAAGARPAEAGEYTKRAFLNGKLDLTGAESVMDLIAANGRLAAKSALANREGAVFRQLEEVKQKLLAPAAQLTAFIDYPDDDIPELDTASFLSTIQECKAEIQTLLDTFEAGKVIREGVDTAIVGSPNVGKSTLMNLLAGCNRSIVTPIAGTTRDVIEETVRVGDILLRLNDTAGIHSTDDTVEAIGVDRAKAKMNTASLVLAVFDGSRPLSDSDRELADQTDSRNTIAIINKADLPQEIDKEYISSHYKQVVSLSATHGDGMDSLKAAIEAVTGVEKLTDAAAILETERQRRGAADCLEALNEAEQALLSGVAMDAVAVSVDGAINAILALTGEKATEAVVQEVFSRFCVGK